LSQFAFSIFQKKKKGKYGLISFFLGPKPAKAGSARLSARVQAAPRPQPGPGPIKLRCRACPPGPTGGPVALRRWIEWDGRAFVSAGQNHRRGRCPGTLAHSFRRSLSLSLCLLFIALHSSLSHSDETERERARRWSDHGVVAGPLAGARAPQRVSTPPLSGLAVAPPWPSPTSSCLRLGPSSPAPAKGHPDAR